MALTSGDLDFIRSVLGGKGNPDGEISENDPYVSSDNLSSECVNQYEYDLFTQQLTIHFQKRGSYKYSEFPLTEFANFAQSGSFGTYFNLYIRDQYEYERIA